MIQDTLGICRRTVVGEKILMAIRNLHSKYQLQIANCMVEGLGEIEFLRTLEQSEPLAIGSN